MRSFPRLLRLRRAIRFILGPATPTPDEDIPLPRTPLTTSATLPNYRACTAFPDKGVYRLSQSLRLPYFLIPVLLLWATANVLLIREQFFSPASPQTVGCTDALWGSWPPDTCGLNGTACNDAIADLQDGGRFRCLGGCQYTPLGNPRWVGGVEINRQPLIIGGGSDHTYRSDSWLCASAIHAGLINPTLGGCVDVRPRSFPSSTSNLIGGWANGLLSLSFAPTFPGVFNISASPGPGCLDLHAFISLFNAIMLFLTTVFLLPAPPVLMGILIILGWGQILFVSDPRFTPPYWQYVFSGLPPIFLAGYWFYKVSFKRSLEGFKELPLELALWQGIGYWIGIEMSTIFARLPLTPRLGYDGIPPGGIATIVVIGLVVLFFVLFQAWDMRKYGMLQYYLVRYVWIIPILIVLALVPGYTIRIHHWFYPMLAIPVLSLPNRISVFGQALMLGIFLDGVGRWGWAGIIEQTRSLIGDSNSGTYVPDFNLANSTSSVLALVPAASDLLDMGYTGVQVLVDDVLRLADYANNTLSMAQVGLAADLGVDHYFRLAYTANGTSQDFGWPLVRFANGTYAYVSG